MRKDVLNDAVSGQTFNALYIRAGETLILRRGGGAGGKQCDCELRHASKPLTMPALTNPSYL